MTAPLLLSICIPTLNRGRFIGETLASIARQLTPSVEVVIVDGGSTDQTEAVVLDYADRFDQIRYLKKVSHDAAPSNEGFDRDCDHAVEMARGSHCWLFTDDDIIVPGAMQTVLAELADGDPDLLIVDSEVRDLDLKQVFERRRLQIAQRRDYSAWDRDAFMADAGNSLTFVGGVIIRRSCWLQRDRQSYYGTGFVHVCVIFQQPSLAHARILPQSLIQIRMGNAAWSGRSFELWMFSWPELIWSFDGYSDAAKAKVVAREPWHDPLQLLAYRAYGSLRREEYRKFLAGRANGREKTGIQIMLALPGPVAHVLTMVLTALSRSRRSSVAYNLLVASRHSNRLSRAIGRLVGHSLPTPKKSA